EDKIRQQTWNLLGAGKVAASLRRSILPFHVREARTEIAPETQSFLPGLRRPRLNKSSRSGWRYATILNWRSDIVFKQQETVHRSPRWIREFLATQSTLLQLLLPGTHSPRARPHGMPGRRSYQSDRDRTSKKQLLLVRLSLYTLMLHQWLHV